MLFLVLVVLYFAVTYVLVRSITCMIVPYALNAGPDATRLLIIFVFSLLVATVHFIISSSNVLQFVKETTGAVPPDPEDGVHRRLVNVMAEIEIATGSRMKVEPLVIPSLSMNALAVADLKGRSLIAITEGLVSRLSRSQLEAVLAHEAYHILSGDCREASVATSLFGTYAALLEKIQESGEEEGAGIGFHPAFMLFWLLLKLSQMISLLMSREREYRADAASLRMTRNPVAMAEALYLVARNWTGSGIISNGFEMLCIAPPHKQSFDAGESRFDVLFSTHPPILNRVEVLLRLARISLADFSLKMERGEGQKRGSEFGSGSYFVLNDSQLWEGPFRPDEVVLIPWITPSTWIAARERTGVAHAKELPEFAQLFGITEKQEPGVQPDQRCPECRGALVNTSYEKTHISRCRSCGGVLVENAKIPRIIARREYSCDERIRTLARAVAADNLRSIAVKRLKGTHPRQRPPLRCGRCGRSMFRKFYSLAYLVEIDTCGTCGITWFEKDELEMLQCMIEHRIVPRIEADYF